MFILPKSFTSFSSGRALVTVEDFYFGFWLHPVVTSSRAPVLFPFLPVPGDGPTDTFVRPSVGRSVGPSVGRSRLSKTPPRVVPIRAKIGGDVQRGRGMKAVKTMYEKVAPVQRKKIIKNKNPISVFFRM